MAIDPKTQKELARLEKQLGDARSKIKEQERQLQSLEDRNNALGRTSVTKEEHEAGLQKLQQDVAALEKALSAAKSALRGLGAVHHAGEAGRPDFYTVRGVAPGTFMQEHDKIVNEHGLLKATAALESATNANTIKALTGERDAALKRVKELESMDMDSKKLRERLQKKSEEVQEANTRASRLEAQMGDAAKAVRMAQANERYAVERVARMIKVNRQDAKDYAMTAYKYFAAWLMKDKKLGREEAGEFVKQATTSFFGSIDLQMAAVLDGAEAEIKEMFADDNFREEVMARLAKGEINDEGGVRRPVNAEFDVRRNPDGTRDALWIAPPTKKAG